MKKKINYQKMIEEETKDYLKNLRGTIRSMLEASVLSLMGLEKDWHRGFEIDHCNGRNSVLIDTFRELAKDEAKKVATSVSLGKDDIASFKGAFLKELKNQVHREISNLVKDRAKLEAEKIISKVKIDIDALLETSKA